MDALPDTSSTFAGSLPAAQECRRSSLYRVAVPLIIALGIFLAIVQFLSGRDLWMDEAMLGLNVLTRSFLQLFRPLDFVQSAPIGFLFAEKFFVGALGMPDYGLRLFPLGCFVASLLAFERICRWHVRNDVAALAALSLFAFSRGLVYYASEVKQYGCDVLFATLLLGLTLAPDFTGMRKAWRLGVLGALSVFFSNSSCLMLPGVWLGWMLSERDELRTRLRNGVVAGLCWAASFAVYFALFYHDANRESMMLYWTKSAPAFPFWGMGFAESLRLVADKTGRLFLLAFGFLPVAVIALAAAAVGFIRLLRRRAWSPLTLLATPMLLHLFVASLGQYPFAPRLMLYQVPIFLLIIALPYGPSAGNTASFRAVASALALPVIVFLATATSLPIFRNEISPCLTYLANNIQKGDLVCADHFAFAPFLYGASTGRLPPNVADKARDFPDGSFPLHLSHCGNNDEACARNMEFLKGRVWVVQSHGAAEATVADVLVNRPAFWFSRKYARFNGDTFFTTYREHLLTRHGGRILDDFVSHGSRVTLYEFPDTETSP